MPVFIDIHDAPGITPDDVARAHLLDLHTQSAHGVNYTKYWVNEKQGKIFCMCTAPSAEAADAVHREAHGMSAARIMELTPEIADAFLGAAEADKNGAVLISESAELDPGTRTILFTDIVGSTDMTQRLGDETAFAILQRHDSIVRAAIAAAKGREIKHTGDGIMASFVSAAAAVRCAIEVQEKVRISCRDHPGQELRLRIGMAAGEPIEHHHDLFGATVQLASRLCAHAEPEQILVSNTVAELCTGKSFRLMDCGSVALKGFSQMVHVHLVECPAV